MIESIPFMINGIAMRMSVDEKRCNGRTEPVKNWLDECVRVLAAVVPTQISLIDEISERGL